MATIFDKIISGEIPSYKVAEDADFLAFLDVFPVQRGHVLVIPKMSIDYIFDMPDQKLASMHVFAKKVASAIKKVIPCTKIGVSIIGLEVPHAHIHLIPINHLSDMDFNHKKKFSSEEMLETADLIRSAMPE